MAPIPKSAPPASTAVPPLAATTPSASAEPLAPEPRVQPDAPLADAGWAAKGASTGDLARMALSSPASLPLSGATGLGVANVGFGARVTEQVALTPDHALVTGNADRAAAKDTTWSRLTAAGSVALGGGSGPEAGGGFGAGASFGFSAGAQVSVIVPTKGPLDASGLAALVKTQGEAVTLDLHPERVGKLAPGSEFAIADQPQNLDASVGFGAHVTAGPAEARGGVSLSASHSKNAYVKRVVVGQNGQVSVSMQRFDQRTLDLTAGVNAGIKGGGAEVLGGATRQMALDAASGDRRNVILAKPEVSATNITFTVGAKSAEENIVEVHGTFDLKTKAGRAGYEYFMGIDPNQLEVRHQMAPRELRALGVEVAYSGKEVSSGISARVGLGPWEALDFSSAQRSAEGFSLRLKPGKEETIEKTILRSEEYNRKVTGALPRLVNGEEREINVRLSETEGWWSVDRVAVVAMKVSDPKVTASDHQEIATFLGALGLKTGAPTREGGAGTFAVEVGVGAPGLRKLSRLGEPGVTQAFERALEQLSGQPVPWKNSAPEVGGGPAVKESFATAMSEWERVQSGGEGSWSAQRTIVNEYRDATGRDFEKDRNSALAMGLLAKELRALGQEELKDCAPLLSTIGRLSGGDLRAAILTLKSDADAGLTAAYFEANGVKVAAKSR
jgi:hypothetical protein